MSRRIALRRSSVGRSQPAAIARLIALLLPAGVAHRRVRLAIFRRPLPVRDVLVAALCAYCRVRPGAVAFTATAHFARARTLVTLLAALAIAVSGAIGVYHAGVEAKIFEGFTQCTATARAITGRTAEPDHPCAADALR